MWPVRGNRFLFFFLILTVLLISTVYKSKDANCCIFFLFITTNTTCFGCITIIHFMKYLLFFVCTHLKMLSVSDSSTASTSSTCTVYSTVSFVSSAVQNNITFFYVLSIRMDKLCPVSSLFCVISSSLQLTWNMTLPSISSRTAFPTDSKYNNLVKQAIN